MCEWCCCWWLMPSRLSVATIVVWRMPFVMVRAICVDPSLHHFTISRAFNRCKTLFDTFVLLLIPSVYYTSPLRGCSTNLGGKHHCLRTPHLFSHMLNLIGFHLFVVILEPTVYPLTSYIQVFTHLKE